MPSSAQPLSADTPGEGLSGIDEMATDSSQGGRSTRAKNTASALTILARTALSLIIISLLATTFPFQPWSPEWYLRLSQLIIDYSPVFILSIALFFLSSSFEGKTKRSSQQRAMIRRMSAIGLTGYIGLVPLQIYCFGWLWVDSGSQVRSAIGLAESRLGNLRTRIRAAESEATLQAALADLQAIPPPLPGLPRLEDQKRALESAIERDLTQLRSKINQTRMQRVGVLLASTIRGIAGSAVMAMGMLALKRLT